MPSDTPSATSRRSTPIPTIMLALGLTALVSVGLKHGFVALAFIVPRDTLFLLVWVLAVAFLFVEWGTVVAVALAQLFLSARTLRRSGLAGVVPGAIGLALTAAAVVLLVAFGRNFEAGPLLFDSNYVP